MDTRIPEEKLDEMEPADPFDDSGRPTGFAADVLSEPPRPSLFRGPLALVGVVASASLLGVYLYLADENSDRWELRCTRGQVVARKGMYFPWGTRRIADDAHDPLTLPSGASCATIRLGSLQELDRTLGGLLLEAAEQRLQQGGPEALAQARQDVERARRLQGLEADQRQRAEALLADMAYHEAREILRQVERSLWQARRKLERARSLGASERLGDLDEWLRFIELETERFRPDMGSSRPPTSPSSHEPRPSPETPPQAPPPLQPDDVFL